MSDFSNKSPIQQLVFLLPWLVVSIIHSRSVLFVSFLPQSFLAGCSLMFSGTANLNLSALPNPQPPLGKTGSFFRFDCLENPQSSQKSGNSICAEDENLGYPRKHGGLIDRY